MSKKKTILTAGEIRMVAGGGVFDKITRKSPHMGDGRNEPVKCYDANEIAVRGWKARDWEGAKWFCCSGDEGNYYHVVMGNRYRNCKTGQEATLKDFSMPDDLKNINADEL